MVWLFFQCLIQTYRFPTSETWNRLEQLPGGTLRPLIISESSKSSTLSLLCLLKYQHIQTTKWSHLLKAYDECTSFTPTQRSTLDRILQLVNNKEAQHYDVIPLALHQGSAIEDIDKRIAGGHEAIVEDSLQNDGTNSCAFLFAIIGEGISNLSIAPSWQDVVTLTEDVIRNAPSSFNFLRDKGLLYDSQEVANILWKQGVLQDRYEMSEEIISNSSAFTEGKYKVFIHPLKVLACGSSIVQVHSHYYQCKITSRIVDFYQF